MEEARGWECSGEVCGWEQVTRGGVEQLAEGKNTYVHKGLEEVKKVAVRCVGSAATLAGALASACISCGNADARGKSGLKGGEAVWAGGTRVGLGEAFKAPELEAPTVQAAKAAKPRASWPVGSAGNVVKIITYAG